MTKTSIADLSVDEFKQLVREAVKQTLSELFGDPDAGLELDEGFKLELQKSLVSIDTDGTTSPALEVAKKLGLTW